jgi:hypothetical protein
MWPGRESLRNRRDRSAVTARSTTRVPHSLGKEGRSKSPRSLGGSRARSTTRISFRSGSGERPGKRAISLGDRPLLYSDLGTSGRLGWSLGLFGLPHLHRSDWVGFARLLQRQGARPTARAREVRRGSTARSPFRMLVRFKIVGA